MENLPENKKVHAVLLHHGTAKAIEVRRAMIELPEVANVLTLVEKYIFRASTKLPISDIADEMLVTKTGKMFGFIAKDVGYIIPTGENSADWIYTCTRLLDLLKRYYYQLTLSDIKLAFELLITGELDEYLPKDKDGNAERKHYQQFNAEYFTKVLNAYKKKQSKVIGKAYIALPGPERVLSPEHQKFYRNKIIHRCRDYFMQYKYTGILAFDLADEMFVYNWLFSVGLADVVTETEIDRREALGRFLSHASRKFTNEYTIYQVCRQGHTSREIDFTAFEVARRKEIKNTFDRMIIDEIYIYHYLKLEE